MRPKPWSSCSGAAGFTVVPDGQPADVYIVNSCTVTNFGDQKKPQMAAPRQTGEPRRRHRPHRLLPPGVPPSRLPACWKRTWSAATPTAAPSWTNVMQLLNGHERIVAVTPHTPGGRPSRRCRWTGSRPTPAPLSRWEDGCNRLVRLLHHPQGPGARVRSRPISSILAELRQLVRPRGYREVVLSAISLPSYGTDTGTDLYELVEQCAGVGGHPAHPPGQPGPRYAHPGGHPPAGRRGQALPPVPTSASRAAADATLRRMRRPYTTAQYLDVVRQLRQAYAGRPVSFTTDCICGFPGESEEDFVRSCGFLEEVGFLRVHVFPYSRREGTPAYDFPPAGPRAGKAGPQPPDARPGRGGPPASVLARPGRLRGPGAAGDPRLGHRLHRLYPAVCAGQVVSAPGCAAGDIVRVRLGRYDGAPGPRAEFLGRV